MRTTLLIIPVAFALAASACHQPAAPQLTAQPQADSSALAERARQDSLARAAAEARARERADRLAEQQRADSLAARERASERVKGILTAMIHFEFDKSSIRPGDGEQLDQKIPVLRANPQLRIQVVGNCDERGSDEYNLALGNRRAISAKAYLVTHGIEASRIETLSNGKERPLDPGHNAESWAMNRNDQFTVLNADVVLGSP